MPPPLSVQQEGMLCGLPSWCPILHFPRCFPDAIIHTRITNDEKALRRVTKKFHSYASVAYTPAVPVSPLVSSSVDDARETFLLELASFQLSLRKGMMVCEAEARQVDEYQLERERICESKHTALRSVLR